MTRIQHFQCTYCCPDIVLTLHPWRSFFRQGLRVEGKELRCRWWLAYTGLALGSIISPPHRFFPWHKRTPCLRLTPSWAVTHLETALSSSRTWCGAQALPSLSSPAELSCATFFSFWKKCTQLREPEADGLSVSEQTQMMPLLIDLIFNFHLSGASG